MFTAHGNAMVTLNRGIVHRWDLTAAKPTQNPPLLPEEYLDGKPGQAAICTPDGARIAAQTIDNVRVWDLSGAAPVERKPWKSGPALGLPNALTADGKTLATFDSESPPHLRLWDLSGAAPQLTNRVPTKALQQLHVFSADGKRPTATPTESTCELGM